MTDRRNLNERVSLKAVTALVPPKLPLLEPLFGERPSKAAYEPH